MTKLCSVCEISKPENGWTSKTYVDEKSTICKKCSNKKMPKLCSVCEISKPENGWTSETFVDEKSTICKRCSEEKAPTKKRVSKKKVSKKKVSKKKVSKKKVSKKKRWTGERPAIGGKHFPLTVPFTELSNENRVTDLIVHMEKNGPILVSLMKGDNLGSKAPYKFLERQEYVVENVKKHFLDHHVTLLDWPFIGKSGARTSHPFITYLKGAVVIVSPPDFELPPEKDMFYYALTESAYEMIIKDSSKTWVILGDETGGLEEFKSLPAPTPAAMCWIVVPPGIKLPPLAQDFHGTGAGSKLHIPLKALINNESVMCFTFPFEQGTIIKGSGLGEDPHLGLWQDTLPLVIETISNEIKGPVNCDIFIEQVGALEAGIGVIPPHITALKSALNQRINWNNINFDQMWILAKSPCEHPWIGYPDALGHTLREKTIKGVTKSDIEIIRKRTISTPYRQQSLSGPIHQALITTVRSLEFLQSLHNFDASDIRDYIAPYFSNAIAESISSLDENNWQDLLIHIDVQSRDKKGQRVTSLICNNIKIDEVLKDLKESSVKFDLLRMLLGTFNHRGAIKDAVDCKEKAEALLKLGFEPMSEKKRKFNNIARGLKLNMFDFSEIDARKDFEYNSELTKEQIQELGTNSQSLGLTGDPINRKIAMAIEKKLHVHGDDRRHKRRHSILLAELLMDDGSHIKAEKVLNKQYLDKQDSFFFAAQLKNGTLLERNHSIFESIDSDFTELLDDYHPSQRITYWCARWAMQVGENESELVVKCIKHLISLTEIPHFSSDAPGVILSCELMDLESRGYKINIDTMQFYELVKNNSQPSTIEWLKKHPPSEDDWLAPLNFNYR